MRSKLLWWYERRASRVLIWGAQFSPSFYPAYYTRTQRVTYWATLKVWRIIHG